MFLKRIDIDLIFGFGNCGDLLFPPSENTLNNNYNIIVNNNNRVDLPGFLNSH